MRLIVGGPGSGKTRYLVNKIIQSVKARTHTLSDVAFISYTNAAVNEAKKRCQEELGCTLDEMPYFSTIHSMAFRGVDGRKKHVVRPADIAEFAALIGEPHGTHDPDAPAQEDGGIEAMLALYNYARITAVDLRDAWKQHGRELGWWRLKRAADAYDAFKLDRGMVDFTDMLHRYVDNGLPLPVAHGYIDEGQDLTALQWACANRAFVNCGTTVAGDDDQALYHWSGAATDHFIALAENRESAPEYLTVSERMPYAIFSLALRLLKRIKVRHYKPMRRGPQEGVGLVRFHAAPDMVDYSQGEWLLLARTRHLCRQLEHMVREEGLLYSVHGKSSVEQWELEAIRAWIGLQGTEGRLPSEEGEQALTRAFGRPVFNRALERIAESVNLQMPWHEALTGISARQRQYYLAARRKGEKMLGTPRIRIDTIHGAKGQQADNVLLMTDMPARVQRGFELDPDSEHRVFYVGCTRAKEALHVVEPQAAGGYNV